MWVEYCDLGALGAPGPGGRVDGGHRLPALPVQHQQGGRHQLGAHLLVLVLVLLVVVVVLVLVVLVVLVLVVLVLLVLELVLELVVELEPSNGKLD